MSHLLGHARAAGFLGDAFEGQAAQNADQQSALLLMSIATAYRVAQGEMEQAMRDEAGGGPAKPA